MDLLFLAYQKKLYLLKKKSSICLEIDIFKLSIECLKFSIELLL